MKQQDSTVTRLRRLLLGILLFGLVGTAAELILIGHDEDWWQMIPLVVIGLAILGLGLAMIRRAPSRMARRRQRGCFAGPWCC